MRYIHLCRFKFPKFPIDQTKLVFGIPKDTDKNIIIERKKDLNNILKFLIRQTYSENPVSEIDSREIKQNEFLGVFAPFGNVCRS